MNDGGGKLRTIPGKGSRIDTRVKALEDLTNQLVDQILGLETRLGAAYATIKQLVDAGNNTTLVVSSVERFLDAQFGDNWDEGIRKVAEARMELLKRRKELLLRMQAERTTLEVDERTEIAREIWAIARELDIRGEDVSPVVALHIQNSDIESALDVIEEIRRDNVALSNEVGGLVDQLIKRCIEFARKSDNEILVARANSIATLNALR